MLTAFASFGVMVSVMNLTGYVVVEKHHHAQHSVFPIIGAHVVGMYALVLVVGALIDRVGRTPALASGLLVMGASALGLSWISSVFATGVLLFGLGIGWNISYVAAAAQLADLSQPSERGRLFGFNDFAAAHVRGRARAARGPDARDAGRRRNGVRRRGHRHGPGAVAAVPSPSRPRGGSPGFSLSPLHFSAGGRHCSPFLCA